MPIPNNTISHKRFFLIAGEASGDLHAANLVRALKAEEAAIECSGLGGDLMESEGVQLVQHYRNMAFMGFVAVVKNWRKVKENFNIAERALMEFKPDALILIDYPSFNLRMAKFVKRHLPQTKVYYYIAPKLWAWKEYRIKDIKRHVDNVFTIFPFETNYFKGLGYSVQYVGNPTYEGIQKRTLKDQTLEQFQVAHQLSQKPIIALLAGSRKEEIANCLPKMVAAAARFSHYQPVIAGAPSIDIGYYTQIAPGVSVVSGATYQLLQSATCAVVNSGTATLETALIGTPQVVVYYTICGYVATLLKHLFIKTKYISLVNIIAQKEIVKELITHRFTVKNIEAELCRLLTEPAYRTQMVTNYNILRQELGDTPASHRAAKAILKELS